MYRLILVTLYLTAAIVKAQDNALDEQYNRNRTRLSTLTILFKDQQFECFGTIFSRNLMLTSAKCLRGKQPTKFNVEVDLLAPNGNEYKGRNYFAYDVILLRVSETENKNNNDEVIDDIAFLVIDRLDYDYPYVDTALLTEGYTYALSLTPSYREFTLTTSTVNERNHYYYPLNVEVVNETTPLELYIDLPTEIGTFAGGRVSNETQRIIVSIRNEKECYEELQTEKKCDKVLKGTITNNQVLSIGAPVKDKDGVLIGIVSDIRPDGPNYSDLSITKISFAMQHLTQIRSNYRVFI